LEVAEDRYFYVNLYIIFSYYEIYYIYRMKFAGAQLDFLQFFFQVIFGIIGYFVVIGITGVFGKNFLYLPLVIGPFFMIWQLSTYDYQNWPIDTVIINNGVQLGFLYLYYQKFVELSAKNSGQSGAGRKR